MHSDTFSLLLNSTTFREAMREIFDLRGNAYTKRIPGWIFNLSNEQISYVLKGIFSGDGCVSDKEIVIPLASLNLLKDIQTLLLNFGIIFRIGTIRKDKTYNASISALKHWQLFKEKIGILPNYKKKSLEILCQKISFHDTSDVIPLLKDDKILMNNLFTKFNANDYINRDNNMGRNKLNSLLLENNEDTALLNNLRILSCSDIYWDEIKSIEIIENFNDYVYDLSVPENESFICNNIIAHNTLELPTEALRKLGYNIQAMKVRSALTKGGAELSADEGIRTALRMG